MPNALLEKIRKAREFNVQINGHTFTARRPTDAEVVQMPEGARRLDFVHRFVVGWNLTELDVIPGGGPEPVPFDAELWMEWVNDRPDHWEPLATALLDSYRAHTEASATAEKNS